MHKTGQVIIVGGSKGLGRATAERFTELGFRVSVWSRSPPTGSYKFQHSTIDLEHIDSYDELARKAVRLGGKVRYIVFCQRYRGTNDHWQGELKVSLTATRAIINAFTDHFIQSGDRAIGIVSSVYAKFVGTSQPDSYHVVKAGLNQLVKYNSIKLGGNGIRINAILPLTYLKPESQNFYLNDKKTIALYEKFIPLKRMGTVIDSVNLLEFLCSPKASFINGQNIFIDGGVSSIWPEELARSTA